MSRDFLVTIQGARGDEWESVCGQRTFPVKTPLPIRANLPGFPNALAYLLDLSEVEPPILAKIVQHLSAKFSMTPTETEAELKAAGIPILQDDCVVTILNPPKWMGDDGNEIDDWDDDPDELYECEDDNDYGN